jgi:hypothetical protein
MSPHISSSFLAPFQQIFALFCVLMTEICILLFFSNLASKLIQLLITAYTVNTNRIQREFDSNVAIATFENPPASKPSCQKTNFLKLRRAVTSRRRQFCSLPLRSGATCCHFARSRGKGWGWGILSLRAADTEACFVPLPQCFGEGARGWGFSVAEMLFTNRIQREFLFNNCIQSQNLSSASKHQRQKTNLFKRFALLLCSSALSSRPLL